VNLLRIVSIRDFEEDMQVAFIFQTMHEPHFYVRPFRVRKARLLCSLPFAETHIVSFLSSK